MEAAKYHDLKWRASVKRLSNPIDTGCGDEIGSICDTHLWFSSCRHPVESFVRLNKNSWKKKQKYNITHNILNAFFEIVFNLIKIGYEYVL